MNSKILMLQSSGQPVSWLSFQEAATVVARDVVLWSIGVMTRFHGGHNKLGERTYLDIPDIIATTGKSNCKFGDKQTAKLSNERLFARDDYQCQYCGFQATKSNSTTHLNRDHIHPVSKGGQDTWTNVVTSCKGCNSAKGDKTLQQLSWQLLAVPYTPNYFEQMCLIQSELSEEQLTYLSGKFTSDRMRDRYKV